MRPATVAAAAALLAALLIPAIAGAVTEQEAKKAFEAAGCTSCHREGNIGLPWDQMVARLEQARGKYASIDEYVKAEAGPEVKTKLGQDAETWSQLMQIMATLVGKSLDDPNVAKVDQYLQSLFREGGGGQQAEPREKETGAATATSGAAPAAGSEETDTAAAAGGAPAGGQGSQPGAATETGAQAPEGISFAAGVGIAIIVIALVLGISLVKSYA